MRPSTIVGALPELVPFVGPETLQRRTDREFCLRLGANESLFGPSPEVQDAIKTELSRVSLYGDPEGYELREAIATCLGISRGSIRLGAGIDDLLSLFARAYLNPGDFAVTTSGSYQTFEYAVAGAGGNVAYAEYNDDRIDLARLANLAHQTSAKLVYLANPDNPSGSHQDSDSIARLKEHLPKDSLLLLDEAYSDFAGGPAIDEDDERVIRFRTFSKAHGLAGLRVGYTVCHRNHGLRLDKIRMHFNVSRMAQAAALASLYDPNHLKWVVNQTVLGREALSATFRENGLVPLQSSTNFVTARLGSRSDAEGLLADLQNASVFIRKPGKAPLDNCIRVTIGPKAVMEAFAKVLRTVREATT